MAKYNVTVIDNVIKVSTIGIQGPPGQGVPAGGTTGQFLVKATNTDFDTQWITSTTYVAKLDDIGDVNTPTPSDGDVLKYDAATGTWVNAISTGTVWGSITGTLSNQTDLQNALNAKVDQTTLDAHTTDSTIHFTQAQISITESQISDLQNYALVGHTHVMADITDATWISDISGQTLTTLSDVNAVSPADGQVLTWSATNGVWAPANVLSSVAWGDITGTLSNQIDLQSALDGKASLSHTHVMADITDSTWISDITGEQLGSLSDVVLTTPASGEHLVFDGTNWVNQAPSAGSVAWGDITGTLSNQTDLQSALDGKSNVGHTHTSTEITDWATAFTTELGNNSINALSDVVITTPSNGHFITYNGTSAQWENAILSASKVSNTPAGNIIATDVQAAINELDTEKAPVIHTHVMTDITDSTWISDITNEQIGSLSDVVLTTPVANDLLRFDGTNWINIPDSTYEPAFTKNTAFNKDFGTVAGTVAEGNHNHDGVYEPANANIQAHIADTNNPHGTSVSNLSDTVITTPSTDQVIAFDGFNWINRTLSGLTNWLYANGGSNFTIAPVAVGLRSIAIGESASAGGTSTTTDNIAIGSSATITDGSTKSTAIGTNVALTNTSLTNIVSIGSGISVPFSNVIAIGFDFTPSINGITIGDATYSLTVTSNGILNVSGSQATIVMPNYAAGSEPSTTSGGVIYDTTNNVLKYSDGTSWLNIGGANQLNDLSDVVLTTPISGQRLEYDGTNWINVDAYKPLSINAQTAAYTLALTDAGKLVEVNSASAVTVTVPDNATVAFEIGTEIIIQQEGAGQVSIAGATGVTINSAGGLLNLASQYSAATLIKKATDTWLLVGDLA